MKIEAQTQRVQTCIANAQALYRGTVTYIVGPEKVDFVGFMEIWATSFG